MNLFYVFKDPKGFPVFLKDDGMAVFACKCDQNSVDYQWEHVFHYFYQSNYLVSAGPILRYLVIAQLFRELDKFPEKDLPESLKDGYERPARETESEPRRECRLIDHPSKRSTE